MAEDKISLPVAPSPTSVSTSPTVDLKMFKVAGLDGLPVEIQAVCLVDEFGDALQPPLANPIGVQILNVLIAIHNVLAEAHGTGIPLPQLSPAGPKET